jgi:hypothetical protein
VPPSQSQGFDNPRFNLTRPGDPLPPVPQHDPTYGDGDDEEDDVWNFDPNSGNDPSYAEVRETEKDLETTPVPWLGYLQWCGLG